MKRCLPVVIGLAALAWAPTNAADFQDETEPPNAAVPIPLKVSNTVSFWERETVAWLPPVHCDGSGNVFLVEVPPAQPPAVPGGPPRGSLPLDIRRISADGKKTTVMRPATAPELADVDTLQTLATAVGSQGTLFALVVAERGEMTTQYVISFDEKGKHRSTVALDFEEMFAASLEVFDSGEFLLQGFRRNGEPRVTVMSQGGSLNDVFDLSGFEPSEEGGEPVRAPMTAASGGDGRIYFVSRREDSIHVIEPSGASRMVVELEGDLSEYKVVDLKAARDWVAVTYYDGQPSGKASGRFWIAVYNPILAELEGVYGPASSPPFCYQYERRHKFTLFKDGRYLVTVTP